VAVARHSIIEVGRELIAAKGECGHGGWLPWLESEFGWSGETAQRYMRVADTFGRKSVPGTDLASIEAHALYALASPRVPQIVRDEAVDRAEAGAADLEDRTPKRR
jgi:hypothetical protein